MPCLPRIPRIPRIPHRRVLAAALTLALARQADAVTITVTHAGDFHVAGGCSLREAIDAANTDQTPADTNCAPGELVGSTISIPFPRIEIAAGSLSPIGGTSIIGAASSDARTMITRAADADAFPIFVTGLDAGATSLQLVHLEITGGVADGGGGGGIRTNCETTLIDTVVSGNTSAGHGGGIYAGSNALTLIDSTVSGNTATLGGGGIAGRKYLDIERSTVSFNETDAPGAGVEFSAAIGFMRLRNSTITGNVAHGASSFGAGVFVSGYAGVMIENSTIARNASYQADRGAGLWIVPVSGDLGTTYLELTSSIVADNVASKYERDIASSAPFTITGGHSIVPVSDAATGVPPDTLACDPGLGAPTDNGGPTETLAIRAASCAIDRGANDDALETDQRGAGHPRVVGATTDIGAFEYSERIFANGFD
jgi:CSLREA domain-containing protein